MSGINQFCVERSTLNLVERNETLQAIKPNLRSGTKGKQTNLLNRKQCG